MMLNDARKRRPARRDRLASVGLTDAEITRIMDDDWEPKDDGRIAEILKVDRYHGRLTRTPPVGRGEGR